MRFSILLIGGLLFVASLMAAGCAAGVGARPEPTGPLTPVAAFWKCKRRGPERKEYCHVFPRGLIEQLKYVRLEERDPCKTPRTDRWLFEPELAEPLAWCL